LLAPDVRGTLIAIGGREQKEGDCHILEEVVARADGGAIVVSTLASEEPQEQWQEYERVFKRLGAKKVVQLGAESREELLNESVTKVFSSARVFFMAGGDQKKIASKLGGTVACDCIRDLLRDGGTIAGTSSGASVLSETMLVAGETDESHQVGGVSLQMAPGLGLVGELIIDQHFAERGRIGRLIGAVARNPRLLGLGIDEDTAAVIERDSMRVLGSGAIYVVDGREITFSNTGSDEREIMSAYNVRLHVLSGEDQFDFSRRVPIYVQPKLEEEPAEKR
jgi:cyanophycinase